MASEGSPLRCVTNAAVQKPILGVELRIRIRVNVRKTATTGLQTRAKPSVPGNDREELLTQICRHSTSRNVAPRIPTGDYE